MLGFACLQKLCGRLLIFPLVQAASIAALCSAAPQLGNVNHVLHEKRDGSPHQWTRRDRAAAHEVL